MSKRNFRFDLRLDLESVEIKAADKQTALLLLEQKLEAGLLPDAHDMTGTVTDEAGDVAEVCVLPF